MKLLIDGDGIIYRCGFAVEKTKYLIVDGVRNHYFDTHKEAKAFEPEGSDIWSRKEIEPLENALALVKGALEAMPEHDDREIWLTPRVGNFRDRIAVTAKYKGNRETAKRPIYFDEITDYLVGKWGAQIASGEEADDRLGIGQTRLGNGSCIVSFDKDLRQIAGRHYNWVTKEHFEIDRRSADLFFYTQVIAGDPVDNVPGLKGIGPAKASKILSGCGSTVECWKAALEAYKSFYGDNEGEARALETARLVYVRRKPDEIWQPPIAA